MQEEVLALTKVADRSGIQAGMGFRKRCQPALHIRQARFHSQTETSACLPVSHFLQTNRIFQNLFLGSLLFT